MTDEETKTEEATVEDNDDGLQQKTTSELDRADQIAERLKRENDRKEELLIREENLAARRAVGGLSEAGQVQEKPKEETPAEYMKKVMSGEFN